MKILKYVLIGLGVIIVAVFGYLIYLGIFASVDIRKGTEGGELLVYERVVGNFSKVGEPMERISKTLKDKYGLENVDCMAIYYDNPEQVPQEKLRSDAGCLIPAGVKVDTAALARKFSVKLIPRKEYIITDFPYHGTPSIFVSVMKVYPALKKYFAENKVNGEFQIAEIYDMKQVKIRYRVGDFK
ncbi:MAG: hypothetical protein ACM3U1_07660 [Chloroflexota bacterium]